MVCDIHQPTKPFHLEYMMNILCEHLGTQRGFSLFDHKDAVVSTNWTGCIMTNATYWDVEITVSASM